MRTGKRIAILALVAFAAVCATLLAMPNVDMPCTVTVNYHVTRFVPTSKNRLAGVIRTVDQSKDMAGTGRMRGSSFVCTVSFNARS